MACVVGALVRSCVDVPGRRAVIKRGLCDNYLQSHWMAKACVAMAIAVQALNDAISAKKVKQIQEAMQKDPVFAAQAPVQRIQGPFALLPEFDLGPREEARV